MFRDKLPQSGRFRTDKKTSDDQIALKKKGGSWLVVMNGEGALDMPIVEKNAVWRQCFRNVAGASNIFTAVFALNEIKTSHIN